MAKETLTFLIEVLEIKKIAKGENKGQKYLEMTVIEDSPFAEKSHKQCIFVPQTRIPMWEKMKESGEYPEVIGKYEIVKGLPPYEVLDSDDKRIGGLRTTMRVFCRCDSTGTPVEDPQNQCLRIIERLDTMNFVDVDNETEE